MTELETLKAELKAFARERDWEQFHTPKNLAMALSVEVAELVEIFQWLTPEQAKALSKEQQAHLAEEIGDVMIYLTRVAETYGIDVVKAAREKLEKSALKYPAEKARGSMRKYDEL